MKIFSNNRTQRRAVMAVLLVWVFALGSSWANACLLQDPGAHAHASSDNLRAAHLHVWTAHLDADSEHDANAGGAKDVCLKVCDDGKQAIVKLPSSGDLTNVAMAPPVAHVTWAPATELVAAIHAVTASPPPSPGLPLRTLFSRLTL